MLNPLTQAQVMYHGGLPIYVLLKLPIVFKLTFFRMTNEYLLAQAETRCDGITKEHTFQGTGGPTLTVDVYNRNYPFSMY